MLNNIYSYINNIIHTICTDKKRQCKRYYFSVTYQNNKFCCNYEHDNLNQNVTTCNVISGVSILAFAQTPDGQLNKYTVLDHNRKFAQTRAYTTYSYLRKHNVGSANTQNKTEANVLVKR